MAFSADERVAMLLSLYSTCRGQTPSPRLALVKFYAKQCVFCYAATLASSASLMTWLATIQSLHMPYFRTHGERMPKEVTLEDLTNGTGKDKPGYEKIRFCGE
jgi:hypothetical protein